MRMSPAEGAAERLGAATCGDPIVIVLICKLLGAPVVGVTAADGELGKCTQR